MDPAVRKELDTMLGMVVNWREDKMRMAGGENGWDFLAKDLTEEIEEHIYPYVRRMLECNYITVTELSDFLNLCFAEVTLLADHLKPVKDG